MYKFDEKCRVALMKSKKLDDNIKVWMHYDPNKAMLYGVSVRLMVWDDFWVIDWVVLKNQHVMPLVSCQKLNKIFLVRSVHNSHHCKDVLKVDSW